MPSEAGEPLVLQDLKDGVATLTLNRPAQANTLSNALMDQLEACVLAADANAEVRVIVIGSTGRIFCAGHDLAEMQTQNSGAGSKTCFEELFARCSRLMLLLRNTSKPVIARVQGAAVAAGCQLVASCDLAYAASHAKFGVNGINLGLFCSTPSVALSRTILPKQALEMLLTGQLIDAQRAVEIGLINRATAADDLASTVAGVALMIAEKNANAIALGKDLFRRQLPLSPEQAYAMAGERMAENISWDDTRALIDKFITR